jgi:hypothetical protein
MTTGRRSRSRLISMNLAWERAAMARARATRSLMAAAPAGRELLVGACLLKSESKKLLQLFRRKPMLRKISLAAAIAGAMMFSPVALPAPGGAYQTPLSSTSSASAEAT